MRTVLDIILGNYFRAVLVVTLGVVPLLIFLQLFRTYWRLRHIPGPFSATFTNLQRVLWVKTRQAHLIHQHVHEQYGPVVRTGPNMVMFDDPDAIPIVHTMRRGFPKVSYLPLGSFLALKTLSIYNRAHFIIFSSPTRQTAAATQSSMQQTKRLSRRSKAPWRPSSRRQTRWLLSLL